MMVFNQNERCGAWAMERIPAVRHFGGWGEFQAFGWEKNGELQAVVVFNYYSGADICMHVAAVPGKRWMTREFLRTVFAYPFLQLNCRRISGYIPAKAKDVIAFDSHIGFVFEGRKRAALPDDDLVVMGMLREECRFLPKVKERLAA